MLNIQLEQVLPSEIERRSFELIDQELKSMGVRLKPEQEPVIKRAIHTTADLSTPGTWYFLNTQYRRVSTPSNRGR